MKKITRRDFGLLRTFAALAYSNPFSTERIELEKQALGSSFVADDSIAWSRSLEVDQTDRPNVRMIASTASDLVNRINACAESGRTFEAQVWKDYWDVVTYVLIYRHIVSLHPDDLFKPAVTGKIYDAFLADYRKLINVNGIETATIQPPDHLFACLCQVQRAFYNIFHFILGDSLPSVQLRRSVWESVFTNDMRRYRRTLYRRMTTLPTLITGPSGTGKELVARAIGLSQYIPFDVSKKSFGKNSNQCFFPLNLSAMSETLIESELFGHRKGAFTGAVANRDGWLAKCPCYGAIFLDEIGELAPSLQVKLLRVVQQRTYSPSGSTDEHQFEGKIIGATNRDMDAEISNGNFRADLYFRLCADRIKTPSLRDQLKHRPEDLRALVYYVATRFTGDESSTSGESDSSDADGLTDQTVDWIEKNLGLDYPWAGNIRELEQCVSGVMIRGHYVPAELSSNRSTAGATFPSWIHQAFDGTLNADQLLQHYCHWIHQQRGTYEGAAKHLGIDRRTVKAKIEALKAGD